MSGIADVKRPFIGSEFTGINKSARMPSQKNQILGRTHSLNAAPRLWFDLFALVGTKSPRAEAAPNELPH